MSEVIDNRLQSAVKTLSDVALDVSRHNEADDPTRRDNIFRLLTRINEPFARQVLAAADVSPHPDAYLRGFNDALGAFVAHASNVQFEQELLGPSIIEQSGPSIES